MALREKKGLRAENNNSNLRNVYGGYIVNNPLPEHTISQSGNPQWYDQRLKARVLDPSQPEQGLGGTPIDPTTDFLPIGLIRRLVELGAAGLKASPILAGVTAFHGSPYKFDKFKLDKIGTGEGAQAYGHGLYFAQNPNVAADYANKLSATKITQESLNDLLKPGNIRKTPGGSYDKIKSYDPDTGLVIVDRYPNADLKGTPKTLSYRDTGVSKNEVTTAKNLYKVDIPDEAIRKMLDWDKPLSQQPENVRKAVKELGLDWSPKETFGNWHQKQQIGKASWQLENLSTELNKLGIPGIKYLDQGSRQSGKGTYNFVVFDENLPKILERK